MDYLYLIFEHFVLLFKDIVTVVVVREELPQNAAVVGKWLRQELEKLQRDYPEMIKEVRGVGLMIGIEFEKQNQNMLTRGFAQVTEKMENVSEGEAIAALVARELLKRGVVTAFTLNRECVIRIAPPLISSEKELFPLLEALDEVLRTKKSLWALNGGVLGAIKSVLPKKV